MAVRQHSFSPPAWYGHEKDEVIKSIETSFKDNVGPKILPRESKNNKLLSNLLGIVSPHAGYSCSGPHASHGYLELSKHKNIDSVIILGTNHTGMGSPTSLFPKGEWETPLGSLRIDEDLHDLFVKLIADHKNEVGFEVEPYAHIREHSIDNQLPFLQYTIQNEFTILPIGMWDHSLKTCRIIAEVLSKIISISEKKIVIVASSDFSHYLPPSEAEKRDKSVLDYLLQFNLDEAEKAKKKLDATICGFGPVVTLFATAINLNMKNKKLLVYGHSGQTCGNLSEVVAYSSIIIGS